MYRLSGAVRVDETGEPAAGAKLQIHAGDAYDFPVSTPTFVETGADGRFAVELAAGPVRVRITEPPAGYYYLRSSTRRSAAMESLWLGPEEPAIHREYRVHKGVVWNIKFTRGKDRRPFPGFASWSSRSLSGSLEAQADDAGNLRVTLPPRSPVVTLSFRESAPYSDLADTGSLSLTLFWDVGFRPDTFNKISAADGVNRGFHLVDVNGRSATLHAPSLRSNRSTTMADW